MGKQRKARRRSLRPPLSLLDKSIYWAGFLVSLVFAGALYIFIFRLLDIIAFRDPSVIAYKSHGTHLFTIPFLLYLGSSPFIFIFFSLESRKPIFGSRKIRYGETPWEKDCFPIFDPRRNRVHILPSQKALRRRIALSWLIALLFTSLIAFFGLFGRVCLTQEHHIISYNAVNQESSVSYTPEDYSHLTLQTKYVTGYRSASYLSLIHI